MILRRLARVLDQFGGHPMIGRALAVALAVGLGLVLSRPVLAHDPDVATFEARELEQGWVLAAHLPTAAVQRAVPGVDDEGQALDRAAYEQALVGYLHQHVSLDSDRGPLELGTGGVRLGGHQTDLIFTLELPPGQSDAAVTELRAHIDAFSSAHQVNALRIRPREGPHLRYMLRASNDYAAAWPGDAGVVLREGPQPTHEVERPEHAERDDMLALAELAPVPEPSPASAAWLLAIAVGLSLGLASQLPAVSRRFTTRRDPTA